MSGTVSQMNGTVSNCPSSGFRSSSDSTSNSSSSSNSISSSKSSSITNSSSISDFSSSSSPNSNSSSNSSCSPSSIQFLILVRVLYLVLALAITLSLAPHIVYLILKSNLISNKIYKKCKVIKQITCFDKKKSVCKECNSSKVKCEYCSVISFSGMMGHVKRFHEDIDLPRAVFSIRETASLINGIKTGSTFINCKF